MKRFVLIVALVLLASCEPGISPVHPEVSEDSPVLRSIVDASAEGGNPGFSWLSPIVKNVGEIEGEFDPSFLPFITVEICELSAEVCVGEPIRSFTSAGEGSEQLRISEEELEPHYHANWQTKGDGLDATRDYRIRVLVGELEVGHVDVDVLEQGKRAGHADRSAFVAVRTGQALPIKFILTDDLQGAGVLGVEGGTMSLLSGAEVMVGAGELVGPTLFLLSPESGGTPGGIGGGVRLTIVPAETGGPSAIGARASMPANTSVGAGISLSWTLPFNGPIPDKSLIDFGVFLPGIGREVFVVDRTVDEILGRITTAIKIPTLPLSLVGRLIGDGGSCEDQYGFVRAGSASTSGAHLIFVHGWDPDITNCGDWRNDFDPEASGEALLQHAQLQPGEFTTWRFTYPTFRPIVEAADHLATAIRNLPVGARVVLVGHSMGGLVGRGALLDPDVAARVLGLVTLGTPHAGAPIADPNVWRAIPFDHDLSSAISWWRTRTAGARDMRPGSDFLQSLSFSSAVPIYAFTGQIEAGDVQPLSPQCAGRVSVCSGYLLAHLFYQGGEYAGDDGVVPLESAKLDDASWQQGYGTGYDHTEVGRGAHENGGFLCDDTRPCADPASLQDPLLTRASEVAIEALTNIRPSRFTAVVRDPSSLAGDQLFIRANGTLVVRDPADLAAPGTIVTGIPTGLVAATPNYYNNSILAVTDSGRLYESTSPWTHWTPVGSLPGATNVRALTQNPASSTAPFIVVTGDGSTFQVSPQTLNSGVLLNTTAPVNLVAIVPDRFDNSTLAVTSAGRLVQLGLGQHTWINRGSLPVGDVVGFTDTSVTTPTGDYVFITGNGRVYEIDPRRLNQPVLRTSSAPLDMAAIAPNPRDGNILGVTRSGDIYRSDGSTNWSIWNRADQPPPPPPPPSPASLAASYPFNGNTLDVSGNGIHGSSTTAQLTEDRFGNPNSAYQFDGDDFISMGNKLNLGPSGTISLWFRSTDLSRPWHALVTKGGTSTPGANLAYSIYHTGSGTLYGDLGTGTGTRQQPYLLVNGAVTQGVWHHVVYRFGDGVHALFVDGVLVQENPLTITPGNHANPFYLGRWSRFDSQTHSDFDFVGVMDDVSVYDGPITDTQVLDLCQAGGWTCGGEP
jgi:Concanavalin A-like lectin/glucanases superfamily/PGAP1-like protein